MAIRGEHFLMATRLGFFAISVSLCVFAVNPQPAIYGGAAQTTTSPIEPLLAEGAHQLSGGQFKEAVQTFNQAKQDAPQDARPYFYCGMALSQSGRMEDAASELVEAVHLAPERLEYRVFQAHVFEQLKQTVAADSTLTPFKETSALRQLPPAWLRLLTDDFFQLGESDMALRVLDVWTAVAPGDAGIDFVRGQVYLQKAQPDLALQSFQRSVEKPAPNPQAYYEIGKLLYERNQYIPAKNALVIAVRADANNPEYASKLASVYLSLKEPDTAIKCLEPVESAAADSPTVYYVLARAYRQKGDSARSAEFVDKFQQTTAAERERTEHQLQIDSPIAQARRQLDQGHMAEARALFEKAMQLDPNRWEPNANLAEMDLNSGDFKSAFPHLEKLQQINPNSAVGNFLMARYWFHEKNYQQARIYAERVESIRPDNSELRTMLGDIYSQLGEKQKATQEYEEALRLAPDRQDVRERLEKAEGGKQPNHRPGGRIE
jgi:Flp pilus assembly protein TadD